MTDPHETAGKLVEAGVFPIPIGEHIVAGLRDGNTGAKLTVAGRRWLPDLSDPATCGVLMGMLMERCRGHVTVDAYGASFEVYDRREPDGKVWGADVLGEAMALALLEMKETTDD